MTTSSPTRATCADRRRRSTHPRTWRANQYSAAPRPQPGVDEVVGDVDEEADHDHDGGDQEHRALDLVEVAVADVVEEHPADAGQVEQLLDDHDAGDQAGELDAEHRDDRDRRVAQPVDEQGLERVRPLARAVRM